MRRAWARSVRGNPRGAEGRGRARLRGGGTPTRKERDAKGFEGFCRRGFAGEVLRAGTGVLASQALLLPLTPGTELYCGTA